MTATNGVGSTGARGSKIRQAGETRSASVESLRALAAISVVWSHAWLLSRDYTNPTYPERLATGGVYGPYLFFVLSGYLLFWPFAQAAWGDRRPISVRNYAINRAWRMLPLYYSVLVIIMFLQYHGGTLQLWVAFATFTQDFSVTTAGQIDPPMWTVATEMQFYFVLPLIAWGLARVARGSVGAAAIALATLAIPTLIARQVIRYGVPVTSAVHWLDYTVIECFCYFALGMALALCRLSLQQRRRRWLDGPLGHSTVWLVGGVLLWMVACYRASWEFLAGLAALLIVGAVVLPLRRHGRGMALLRWRPLALLGVISYSLYLWHWPVLVAISNRSLTNPIQVIGRGLSELFVLGLPVLIAVAALSYWQIERRGLARRRPWSANAVSVSLDSVESAGADSNGSSAGAELSVESAGADSVGSPAGAELPAEPPPAPLTSI